MTELKCPFCLLLTWIILNTLPCMLSSLVADEMESNVSALMMDQYLWKDQDRRNTGNRKKVKLQGRLTQSGVNLVGSSRRKCHSSAWLGCGWSLSWKDVSSEKAALRGFPGSSAGDPGSTPGSGRSSGEGIGHPFQYSWASLVAQLVKDPPAMWETWVGKIPWRKERLPTPIF